jgi:Zn finger protein HypA/HybF involved in hydrogenase expression
MHEMRAAQRLVDEAVELLADERAERVIDVEVVLGSAARRTAESVRSDGSKHAGESMEVSRR